MFDILSLISKKKRQTNSGWHSFNAVCCIHRGHRADTRYRGGIKFDGSTNWVMHCFNCSYSCNFVLGKTISAKTRQFLSWCGVDNEQIQQWSLESLKHKDFLDFVKIDSLNTKVNMLIYFLKYCTRNKSCVWGSLFF